MLNLVIPETEYFDRSKNEFVTVEKISLSLEHSLVSISKWESKWKKPFMDRSKPKTREETLDYIRCMSINKNVDMEAIKKLPNSAIKIIQDYIDNPMTATWFSEQENKKPSREIVTSETIYYLMIANGIPFECQKWHLNRLLTLIHVCQLKNEPKKKMSRREEMATRKALNAQRRARHNTRG